MKKVIIIMSLLTTINVFAGVVDVKVNGMVCSMCAQGIQKKFSKDPAVKELNVNLDDKLVTIKEHEGKSISDSTIKKFITEAGYNVASISRK